MVIVNPAYRGLDDQLKANEMGGAMARMGEFHTVLVEEYEGRPERLRPREEDNIKIYLLKNRTGGSRLDSPGTRLRPLYGFCLYGNEHSGFIKCREFLD